MLKSIAEQLSIQQIRYGKDSRLPLPDWFQVVVQKARCHGFPITTVYLLSEPLCPGLRGDYCRTTGELWCSSNGQDEHEVIQTLLVLCARSRQPLPITIDQDRQQEQEAYEAAWQLAADWNLAGFSEQALITQRCRLQQLADWHQQASNVVGMRHPLVVRSAYASLERLRWREGWDDERWEEALYGISERPADTAPLVDFDRSVLRSTWCIQSTRPDHPPDLFGSGSSEHATADRLRSALERAATMHEHGWSLPSATVVHQTDDQAHFLHFLQVVDDQSFVHLLLTANALLIEQHPEVAASACWTLYSDHVAPESRHRLHLYQLRVVYSPLANGQQETQVLWGMFPTSRQRIEAAWQRYILSWRSVAAFRAEPLATGLLALWPWLEPQP